MDTLSHDIISYIGKFLPANDRKACLETSSIFKDVNMHHQKNHRLTFRRGNVLSKLLRMHQTLCYIKRIKQSLKRFVFEFDNITWLNVITKSSYESIMNNDEYASRIANILIDSLGVKEVLLKINCCNDECIQYVTSLFKKCIPCNGYVILQIDVTKYDVNGDEPWLSCPYMHNIMISVTSNSKHLVEKLTHIPKIGMLIDYSLRNGDVVVDLSLVDRKLNKDLIVTLDYHRNVPIDFVCIGHATMIQVFEQGTITRNLVRCLQNDAAIGGCGIRIGVVNILSFEHIEHGIWKEFVNLLSIDVQYRVNVYSPMSLWYVQELKLRGATNIVYNCNSRQSWLAAHFVQKCFGTDHDIVLSATFKTEYRSPGFISAGDYYTAMETEWQMLWLPVYLMWQRHAH